MKVIFFCGHKSPYGLAHLKPLLESNFNIVGLVLATDKTWNAFREKLSGKIYYPYSSYKQRVKIILKKLIPQYVLSKIKKGWRESTNVDVKKLSKKYKIPIWYSDDINSEEFIQKIKKIQPDLIISAAYPQIFSKKLLSIPKQGAINFHPSLLPKFRGAHPHYWTIVKGEKESGLTAHFMTERIDEGDIIAQIKFPIEDYDYNQLQEEIIKKTPVIIEKVEKFFLKEEGCPKKQDPLRVSYFRNDREIHHRIFWNIHTAQEIFNLVRGGNAFCFFRNLKIVITKCYVTKTNRNLTNNVKIENGTIVDLHQKGIAIKAISGVINVTKLKYKGRKINAPKFIIKYKPLIGERFV